MCHGPTLWRADEVRIHLGCTEVLMNKSHIYIKNSVSVGSRNY